MKTVAKKASIRPKGKQSITHIISEVMITIYSSIQKYLDGRLISFEFVRLNIIFSMNKRKELIPPRPKKPWETQRNVLDPHSTSLPWFHLSVFKLLDAS
jgi:hypothetical protein